MNTTASKRQNNLKSISVLLIVILASLSCKAVTGGLTPATPIAAATNAPASPVVTQPVGATAISTVPANSAGVRACYYIPGESVPVQMPPEVLATPTPYAFPTLTPPPTTSVDAATTERQLKIFHTLWQEVNDNYVYTDFNGLDWKAIGDRYEAMINKGLSDDDFYSAMSIMMYELGDEHSAFLSPTAVKDREKQLAGQNNFVGIGAYVMRLDDQSSAAAIITVFPDSPAAKAGLRAHDKILGADGGPLFDEKTGLSRTLGVEGTQVTITVQTPGDAPHDVTLTRASIAGNWPIDYCIVPSTRIGYIFLPTFYDETIPDQMREALKKMTSDGPLQGLIVDVRTNSGGALSIGGDILGLFTSGVSGHFVSRTSSHPFEIQAEDINGSQNVPLIILVDAGTASMGEIFSGILRVSNRARIVGRNTLGNVEVLHPYEFEDGSLAYIAAETFEPVGEANGVWERTGIIPDASVPTRWDLFTEANDPALAKAVELLLQK